MTGQLHLSLDGRLAELCQTPPDVAAGIPIGVEDWRLVVEILLPAHGTLWDIFEWADATAPDPDDAVWDELGWADITEHARGIEWGRGADEPLGRPRVGTATVTLDSTGDRFSPWNPEGFGGVGAGYFSPGTLVRWGLRSATDERAGGWLPQFTGTVESWPQQYVGVGADRFVDLALVEPFAQLAGIDDNALSGVVGGGEGVYPRVRRLLRAADWPYGLIVRNKSVIDAADPETIWPMQSTNMAQNRVVELYRTVDSGDAEIYSDRTGAALLAGRWYEQDDVGWPLQEFSYRSWSDDAPVVLFRPLVDAVQGGEWWSIAYDADSFTTTNDDEGIRNDIRLARVGGTQQVAVRATSIGKYGRRSWARSDLIAAGDGAVATIAAYILDRRSRTTITVENLTVDVTRQLNDRLLTLAAYDIGNLTYVAPPGPGTPGAGGPEIFGYCRAMTHRIAPRSANRVTWSADFAVDTLIVFNLPGAFLP